jgi:hypothetical protein
MTLSRHSHREHRCDCSSSAATAPIKLTDWDLDLHHLFHPAAPLATLLPAIPHYRWPAAPLGGQHLLWPALSTLSLPVPSCFFGQRPAQLLPEPAATPATDVN